MRVSEFYSLGLTQGSLDFVDVDVENDVPLFIDPRAIATELTGINSSKLCCQLIPERPTPLPIIALSRRYSRPCSIRASSTPSESKISMVAESG